MENETTLKVPLNKLEEQFYNYNKPIMDSIGTKLSIVCNMYQLDNLMKLPPSALNPRALKNLKEQLEKELKKLK